MLKADSLPPALEGIRIAYYLVHSMGRGGDSDFAERDAKAADNFATAAEQAGVERIIYLGGLGDPGSEHLQSRHHTAEILGEKLPLTYFRAAAVIGARQRVLSGRLLPRAPTAGDGHPELGDDQDPAHRRRRRGRLPEGRARHGGHGPRDRDRRPRGDHVRRDDGAHGRGARPPRADADPRAAADAGALIAVDRPRHPGRRRRRPAPGRGPGDRDRRPRRVGHGAVRHRAAPRSTTQCAKRSARRSSATARGRRRPWRVLPRPSRSHGSRNAAR